MRSARAVSVLVVWTALTIYFLSVSRTADDRVRAYHRAAIDICRDAIDQGNPAWLASCDQRLGTLEAALK